MSEADWQKYYEENVALKEYIKILEEADAMTAGFLHGHGWEYPASIIQRAEEARKKIEELEKS